MSACALVTTEGLALSAPIEIRNEIRALPRGSLVRPTAACAGGTTVRVQSVAGWVHSPGETSVGDTGCISDTRLTAPSGEHLVSLADAPGVAAGTDLGVLTCDADVRAGGRVVAEATLAVSRAVAPQLLREVESVRALYASLFGPIGLHQVPWTDWGRVGLPLPRTLDAAGLAAEVAREGLATPEQRERAVVAYGGTYAHFLGSDAPGSDAWGSPDAVRSLLRLAKGWHDHCLASGGDEARCLLQIGDLAWYNATKPDPLGHRDHFAGDCVDIRLFRSDGSRYEAWWNRPDDRTGAMAYDAARTTDFLRFATANAPIREAFFNDPAALAAVPGLKPYRGHDDHMHLCFTTGG